MYFGLVDKSRGPQKKPLDSAINSAQDFSLLAVFALTLLLERLPNEIGARTSKLVGALGQPVRQRRG